MGFEEIRSRIEEELFGKLCNDLPRGIDYGGDDDEEDLIVTDDGGETEYHVEVSVILTQVKPEPEWMAKIRAQATAAKPVVDVELPS